MSIKSRTYRNTDIRICRNFFFCFKLKYFIKISYIIGYGEKRMTWHSVDNFFSDFLVFTSVLFISQMYKDIYINDTMMYIMHR
jgi:hypothetical protein